MRRPILEQTTAKKILHFSEVDAKELGKEKIQRDIAVHTKNMRRELTRDGWLVLKIDRLLYGQAGDIQLVAKVVKLGPKPTGAEVKSARRLGNQQGSSEDGRPAAPAGTPETSGKIPESRVDSRDLEQRAPDSATVL